MASIYEAEEDLLRLRRSVAKHSRVLSWRGGSCTTSLVVDHGQKEGRSRWPVGP